MKSLCFFLVFISFAAFAEEPVQLKPQQTQDSSDEPQTHTVYIRGGRPVDPKDAIYFPVVALVRKFKRLNPETGVWELKSSVCSGTVINRVCVLSAEHCTARPGEENVSIEVFNALKIEGAKPVAKVTDFRSPKVRSIQNDIALLRLDAVAPESHSLYTANLHSSDRLPLAKNSLVKIVGYGVFHSNYDEVTKKWTDIGLGEKRDGDMQVTAVVDGKKPLIELGPVKQNHSAAPGDSGGPLILHDYGETIVYGVTGSIDSGPLTNVHNNYYTSVAYHRAWIEQATKELNCTESSARKLNLDQYVQKHLNYDTAEADIKKLSKKDPEKLRELLHRIWDAADMSHHPHVGTYLGVRVTQAQKNQNGELLLTWEGYTSDNPDLDRDVIRRLPGGIRAGFTFIIPPAPKLSREGLVEPIHVVPKSPKFTEPIYVVPKEPKR